LGYTYMSKPTPASRAFFASLAQHGTLGRTEVQKSAS
jgi:hypothetical protein